MRSTALASYVAFLAAAASVSALAPRSIALALEPVGDEIQVNTFTASQQDTTDVSGLSDGGFVVVWESGRDEVTQDGDYPAVIGRRFGADGAPAGTEFIVNVTTTDYQTMGRVDARTDGGFVVVWASYDQDGDYYGVFGRRFDVDGAPIGGEFQVNTYTYSDQYYPDVATTPAGFVVVWDSFTQDGSGEGVFGQRFNLSGEKAGTEFQVNTYTQGRQRFPRVAADADGAFVVVWHSDPLEGATGQDGFDAGIFGQRFAASGQRDGTEFQINTYTTDRQVLPAVAMARDGSFLVAWEGRRGVNSVGLDEVSARLYAPDGEPVGNDFQVNTYTSGFEENAAVAVSGDGEFLVTWETQNGGVVGTDDDDESVIARRVSAAGQPLGTEFQVNTFTPGAQVDPAAAALTNGGFAIAYESAGFDGDLDAIAAQVFSDPICGDASADGTLTASDALLALRTAVGSGSCETCRCDVNDSGDVNASDALTILRAAVGQVVTLLCSVC